MLSPALILGVILSTSYAALFHLWQQGDTPALRRYLVAAWLGFAAGHIISNVAGIHWFQAGHLNVLSGTVGAAVAEYSAKLWVRGIARRDR